MIVIKLLVRQAQFSFWQCNVSILDGYFEEGVNSEVDLYDRQVVEQRPLMIRASRFQDVPTTWETRLSINLRVDQIKGIVIIHAHLKKVKDPPFAERTLYQVT